MPKPFIYEPGWPIPGLVGANVGHTYTGEDGSTVIEYTPTNSVEVDIEGFAVSGDGKSVQLVPGYVQLVTDIREYRVHGRTYAYDVVTVSSRPANPLYVAASTAA